MKACSIENCSIDHYAYGFCRNHYLRHKSGSQNSRAPAHSNAKICSIVYCHRTARTHSFCLSHYNRQKNGSSLAPEIGRLRIKKGVAPCSVNKCTRNATTRTLCYMHYKRLQLFGEVGQASPKTVRFTCCKIDRCRSSVFKRAYCIQHMKMYWVWTEIKQRTTNPNNKAYANYGARGIKICKRWRDSFALFLEDMGDKPTPRHSIDRIDNNGGYEPSNCRWATPRQQRLNTRDTLKRGLNTV